MIRHSATYIYNPKIIKSKAQQGFQKQISPFTEQNSKGRISSIKRFLLKS